MHDSQDIQRNTPVAEPAKNADSTSDDLSFWKLPLKSFIREALRRTAEDVSEAEEWQSFFRFVRLVRGYFKEGISAAAVFDQIDPIICRLGGWGAFFAEIGDSEEAFAQFVSTWEKIRYRPDETPLTNAIQKATAYPLGTSRGNKRSMPGYNRFVALAGWLQVSMGDRSILLPCKEVAQVLKTVPKMVSIWRKWAIEDGYLVVVKEHEFRSGGGGRATEFRFDVTHWVILEKAAGNSAQARRI